MSVIIPTDSCLCTFSSYHPYLLLLLLWLPLLQLHSMYVCMCTHDECTPANCVSVDHDLHSHRLTGWDGSSLALTCKITATYNCETNKYAYGKREERDREGEKESTSFRMGVTTQSGNSHPRSRHVEPDVQVTLRALCLLHNAPAPEERRKEWLVLRIVTPCSRGLHLASCHS